MGTTMFHTPIKTILLVIIHSSKNKTAKVDGFAVIFDGIIYSYSIYLTRMTTQQSTADFQ